VSAQADLRRLLVQAVDDCGILLDRRTVDALAHRLAELLTDAGPSGCEVCDASGEWVYHFVEGGEVFVDVETCTTCGGTGMSP
jgi:hypothetical protein